MSADGKRLNPSTSKPILFISPRLPQSAFRRNHVADGILNYFTNHVADAIWIILSKTTSPMHILMTNLDTKVIQVNFYFFVEYFVCFVVFVTNMHVSGFSSCRII